MQPQPSQKLQETWLHDVTSLRHLVVQALSDCAQRLAKVAPDRLGHIPATRALAAAQVLTLMGAQPRNLPPPQTHAPS